MALATLSPWQEPHTNTNENAKCEVNSICVGRQSHLPGKINKNHLLKLLLHVTANKDCFLIKDTST